MGVIWDGIGFGNSTEIWGGEFFLFENLEKIKEKQSHEVATINSIGQSPMKNNTENCEALKERNPKIKRIAQLENFAWILGDKMSKTPKISALSIFFFI